MLFNTFCTEEFRRKYRNKMYKNCCRGQFENRKFTKKEEYTNVRNAKFETNPLGFQCLLYFTSRQG